MSGTAALGERDHYPAALRLLRRLGACAGIEECKLGHPLRRLAHDLERDVAAHRQARERKARRGSAQDAPRDGRHAVVAGMVCNRDRAESPQGRNLVGVKPRRAGQSGNEHDRQRV